MKTLIAFTLRMLLFFPFQLLALLAHTTHQSMKQQSVHPVQKTLIKKWMEQTCV